MTISMAGLEPGSPPSSGLHVNSFSSPFHHPHHPQFAHHSHHYPEQDDQQHEFHQLLQLHHHSSHHDHQQALALAQAQAQAQAHLHQSLQEEEQKKQQFNQQLGLSHSHESQTSEDDDSRSSGPKSKKRGRPGQGGNSHGEAPEEAPEAAKKPRGRPPGSKNKPKPPIIITQDSDNAMRSHLLEVAGGCDVSECLAEFARRRQRGLCLLSGRGTVANVTLKQPMVQGATVTFHGRFEILSLSGAYLPSAVESSGTSGGLTISLAGAQGQVVGGNVVGVLTAASPVLIVAASFLSAPYDRLPMNAEEEEKQTLELTEGNHHQINNNNNNNNITNLPLSPNLNHGPSPNLNHGCNNMALFNPPPTYITPLNCQLPQEVLAWVAASSNRATF